jgi:DNA-directed RNA polymerase specialized sigma24 family protein
MHVEFATEPEDDHLSRSEIYSKLSNADILRLSEIARLYARRSPMTPDELLNESVMAALSGSRKCPRNVPLIAFLARTMQSIVFNEKRKESSLLRQESVKNNLANDPALSLPDERPTPLETVEAISEIEALFTPFEHDNDVKMLLMGLQDGCSPDEICEIAGWDRKTYGTVRKRLRRGVDKYFPKGRQT